MTIEHQTGPTKGRFLMKEGEQVLGETTYSVAGTDKIIIDHTEGYPGSEGQGVGRKLVMAAVEYARAHGLKIIPLCPFARSVFDRNAAELADVRA
ncbi:MAG: N-acetyltransferase [Flavobacteriales bacterium]|nr:N-acetyltransferase [Flavobacteriales bacterium]